MPSVSPETSPSMSSPAAELASAMCVADKWDATNPLSPYFCFWQIHCYSWKIHNLS